MTPLYKKRPGTSGITGHLYETKLISLVLFRLLHDDRVQGFYLASNMDDVGAFDDICLQIELEGRDRPLALFIQVKHRDNDNTCLTLHNKNDLVKWFDSILGIKMKISNLFVGNTSETECLFIVYTNAGFDMDLSTDFQSSYSTALNSLLATSSSAACRPLYSEQHIDEFNEIILREHLTCLAKQFVTFLNAESNQLMSMMNDDYIRQYHMFLKQKVVHVTDTQTKDSKWRNLTFRQDFFDTDDNRIAFFRSHFIQEILKKHPKIRNSSRSTPKLPSLDKLITDLFSEPSVGTLTPLIVTHIACNENGQLEFVVKRPSNDSEQLRHISMSRSCIEEATYAATTAAIRYLSSLKLKVPVGFGNVDLIISGGPKKIERRLEYLTAAIAKLCTSNRLNKIVTIDDTLDDGLLNSNGGLASAVGNILTFDEATKMLKFSSDFTSTQNNAKILYIKLVKKIDLLHEYRFNIKTTKFPKLQLDCTKEVREFLSKFIIYKKQSNHCEVEEMLIKDIKDDHENTLHGFSLTPDSLFLNYHNEVQKWWMLQKNGRYLTKTSNMYEQAKRNILTEPRMSALHNMFYINNVKYFGCRFNENGTKWLKLTKSYNNIIVVTDSVILTIVKLTQYLTNHILTLKLAVLDLEYVFNLSLADFKILNSEVRETNKLLIIVYRNIQINSTKLKELLNSLNKKQIIIVTNNVAIQYYCPSVDDVLNDTIQNLTAMTLESQKELVQNSKVIFQSNEISLDLLVDGISPTLLTFSILDKAIRGEIIYIGKPLSNLSYQEINNMYIDRRITFHSPANAEFRYPVVQQECSIDSAYIFRRLDQNERNTIHRSAEDVVTTFYDIDDDAVLITAAPGMGKSTLLTHLSLRTKERDAKLWIVRVNFLEHSKQFHKWHELGTVINPVESLEFLCQVALSNEHVTISLKIVKDEAQLVSCAGDDVATFEINIFLHFYNTKRLMFVFDGFDEICPYYKQKVLNFLQVAKTHLKWNKLWVTSRPYNDIVPDLRNVFGRAYQIEHLSDAEQQEYLGNFWREKLIFRRLNNQQRDNIQAFVQSTMHSVHSVHYYWMRRIHFLFYKTVFLHLCPQDQDLDTHNLSRIFNIDGHRSKENFMLSGIPLILYFIADYFTNIADVQSNCINPDLDMHNIYETFIENKLKKILFRAKNKMDLYNPALMMTFEKERADRISVYRTMAASALLQDTLFQKVNFEEFTDMNPSNQVGFRTMLSNIKAGDKAGLISHVTADDVPVFIHRTFTEYFAAEYICSIYQSDKFVLHQKTLWYYTTLVCCDRAVLDWVDMKMKLYGDALQILRQINRKLRPLIRNLLYVIFEPTKFTQTQLIRLMSSSIEDYESYDCFIKYNNFILRFKSGTNARRKIKEIRSEIISYMKPHLKKHFVS